MFDLERWQEIFYSISQNKLRTFLSGFTITLGLFIFIILFGMGNGLQNGFMEQFINRASNVITFKPGKASEAFLGLQENRTITLKNEDLDLIDKEHGKNLEYKTSQFSKPNTPIVFGKETGYYTVQGTYPDKQYIEKVTLTAGRFITKNDMDSRNKFAVIGRLVERDLFKRENALGKYISIAGINYRVIGTYTDEGGDAEERIIYTPLTTMQLNDKNSDTIKQIDISYTPTMDPKRAIELGKNIDRDLRAKLKISPTDKSGLYLRNTAEAMGNTFAILTVITVLVLFIGFGTIIAGIIGISNIMVFIVKERTKEIGIRKALGARPSSIVGLILQESIFITIISGFAGVGLGVLTLNLIGNKFDRYFILNPSVNWSTIITATICLIFFGAIAGFIPAKKAAKIKPIEALRSE
ncbi:ABC transporter permease [Apibacter raozihei]|uniref:ABC transporter permease n=1 Tax=Apibacter TaxID=1778601 RepID=UPI000FE2ABD6|nr:MULTISPECIES: ABC transporter permease [Apibacter]